MTVCAFLPLSTWDPAVRQCIAEHYTGSAGAPPGRKLAWRIVANGSPIGFIGLGEPAFKLAPRRRIGLTDARPLPRTACCFLFRIQRTGLVLSSVLLRAWHPVALDAWAYRYGETLEHWETLVDPAKVRSVVPGACFRRAGYRSLGLTTGRTARRPPGHTHGPRVWSNGSRKLVLYRGPLSRVPPETKVRNG